MNRRTAIAIGLASAASSGVLGFFYLGWREAEISSIIEARLSYLDIKRSAIEAFTRDFLAAGKNGPSNDDFALAASTVGRIGGALLPSDIHQRLERYEERVAGYFLLSTDFFPDCDPSRGVEYVQLADPYLAGCSNLIARVYGA